MGSAVVWEKEEKKSEAPCPMKIAQVSPLIESVPPRLYGGTERVVSYLTEELVRQGHDVTLFASADSETSARLVPCSSEALRLDPDVRDHVPYHAVMFERVKRLADRFDILHFHTDLIHFPVFADTRHVTLTTLHGRQDLFDLRNFYQAFPGMPLVSISNAQRAPLPSANFAGTVLHGLPEWLLPAGARAREGYLAFIGRNSPEKRLDRAIEIAQAAGLPLLATRYESAVLAPASGPMWRSSSRRYSSRSRLTWSRSRCGRCCSWSAESFPRSPWLATTRPSTTRRWGTETSS